MVDIAESYTLIRPCCSMRYVGDPSQGKMGSWRTGIAATVVTGYVKTVDSARIVENPPKRRRTCQRQKRMYPYHRLDNKRGKQLRPHQDGTMRYPRNVQQRLGYSSAHPS